MSQIYHITNNKSSVLKNETGIFSFQELQEIDFPENQAVILLNIHLNWNQNKLSSNHGFEVALHLRLVKKIMLPIILYSPLPQSFFENLSKNSIKYNLLFSPGIKYLETPSRNFKFNKIIQNSNTISPETLEDINRTLCNLKGVILSKLTHDLKFEKFNSDIFDQVKPYFNTAQLSQIQFDHFKTLITQATNEVDFNSAKEQFFAVCNLYLQYNDTTLPFELPKKHHILIVDDYPAELNKIKAVLDNNFFVTDTTSSIKAIELLEKDIQNKYVAVVSDWRLYTNENQNYWQDFQGYEVLRVASKNGLRVLVTLTSFQESIVESTKNKLQLNIELKNKNILNDSSLISEFQQWLYIKCDEILNSLANIPDSDNWKKTERSIDASELKALQKRNETYNIFNLNSINYIKYQSIHEQYLAVLYAERFNYFKNVETKADEILKYIDEFYTKNNSYNDIEPIRSKFGIHTPKSPLLFHTLVLRRIWLAIYYKIESDYFNYDKKLVFAILQNSEKTNFNGNKDDVEMNKLCLSKSQVLNKVFLPEEKAWLIRHNLL